MSNVVPVLELSELLKVPDITIRKDLTALEDKGLLRRAHGFATFPESNDVSTRLLFNYETKRRIDKKDRRGVTIITNSVFIAIFLRDKVGGRTKVLLGVVSEDLSGVNDFTQVGFLLNGLSLIFGARSRKFIVNQRKEVTAICTGQEKL